MDLANILIFHGQKTRLIKYFYTEQDNRLKVVNLNIKSEARYR